MAKKVNVGDYNYRIKSLRHSSDRYGLCEVCKGHVSEVFYQTESRYYEAFLNGIVIISGWTYHECHSYFGHEQCLLSKRRPNSHELDEDQFPMDRTGQPATA